jgi:hypothetical protein
MTAIIPFGKKRGLPVDDLLDDPDYLNWLQKNAAEYARQRYPDFYPVLMNSGRRASETPDHNRLQKLFVYEDYRRAFCRAVKPDWEKDVWSEFVAEVSYQAREVHPEFRDALEQLPAVCWPRVSTRAWFEVKGIDVAIKTDIEIRRITNDTNVPEFCLPYALRFPGESDTFTVEIKCDVGDEYPRVLRQMLALKSRYLFLESYSGTGATMEEFVEIFRSSGRTVVFKDDVDAEQETLKKMTSHECSPTIH